MDNQELLTLINNAGSIFEQIKQMLSGGAPQQGAGTPPAPAGGEASMSMDKVMQYLKEMDEEKEDDDEKKPAFMKAEDEKSPEDKKEDEKEAMKALIKSILRKDAGQGSDTDAVAANDDAEARIKDQPDENIDAVKEVAKALRKIAMGSTVKKSQDNELTQILGRLVDDNRELRKGLENLYEGLGIAEEVRKMSDVEKSLPSRKVPQDTNDVKKSLDEIKAQLGMIGDKTVNPADTRFSLQKALTDDDGAALRGMLSVRNK
jgi:hypothetical protein